MERLTVCVTMMHEGYTWKVRQKMHLKGIEVTCGMSQKFEFEICQILIHTLAW